MSKKTLAIIILLFFLSGLSGFCLSLWMHSTPYPVSPEDEVQLIQTFHSPATFVKQLAGDPAAGKKIFKEFCSACHSPQPVIDVQAPHVGDKKAWAIRRKIGVERLLAITIAGVGAMPARGGCFECSDEQLRETIRYMLDQ